MRILTFLHSFEPGGVERIALRLIRHWRERGVDAPLFMGRSDGAMAGDVGRDLGFITPHRRPATAARWETIWMILTLPGVVRRVRPDVLFCAGNTYAIVAVALKLLLGRDCPPILLKVSNSLDRNEKARLRHAIYRLWLRFQGRFIDHFVAMEARMVAEIATAFRAPPNAITVIPNPALSRALIERLRASPPRERRRRRGRRFVAVGRLTQQKNIAMMLRAFERGARDGDTLTLIGDGPNRARLELLARRLGIGHRVRFRGYIAEPATLLPEFDILILSSDYEGVPAVILEALAADLGIVATSCCSSMAALLMDGALGDIVPTGDLTAMAEAIAHAEAGRQNTRLSLAQARLFTLDHASEIYLSTMAMLRPAATAHQNRPTAAQAVVMLQRH